LLKEIIIAHGKAPGSNGELDESFAKHKINTLLEKLDPSRFILASEERPILIELQKYVDGQVVIQFRKKPAIIKFP
jgi:hypothetical protein